MTTALFNIPEKVAVVTGAGRGIGAATAVALAEAGADVLIAARTESQLQTVAEQIAETGRRAHVVVADLGDLDAVAALAETAVAEFGRLDIVVNNVGGTIPRPFADTSPRYLAEAFNFNVLTAHTLTRAALPHLQRSGDGAVVSISSVMGRVPGRGYLAYSTAKAALAMWTRAAATDLSPNIRVNAVAVGSAETSALDFVLSDEQMREQVTSAPLLRRVGSPDEIAAAVRYLCSPAGAYITGKILEVDGGLDRPSLDLGLPDLAAPGE